MAAADPDAYSALGVRPETVERWRAIGAEPMVAALAQADGFGPDSARHGLVRLRALAQGWRAAGAADAEALAWHRAGFSPGDARRWIDAGAAPDAAALATGRRQRG